MTEAEKIRDLVQGLQEPLADYLGRYGPNAVAAGFLRIAFSIMAQADGYSEACSTLVKAALDLDTPGNKAEFERTQAQAQKQHGRAEWQRPLTKH